MSVELPAPEAEKAEEKDRPVPQTYVGKHLSMKQIKMFMAHAKRGPTNPPKGTAQGERLGERAAIVSLLELSSHRKRHRR